MPYYKEIGGNIHVLDNTEFAHLLPAGCVEITEAEADELRRPTPEQIAATHVAQIKPQIASIEAGQARAVREAALGDMTHLLAINASIEALRAQLP